MALLEEQIDGGTQTADSRFFISCESQLLPFPSEDDMAYARYVLNHIFTDDEAGKEADAQYRRGMQDVIRHRDTPDAMFYAHMEVLLSLANRAYDH